MQQPKAWITITIQDLDLGHDGADGALSGSIQTQTAPSEPKNDSEIETIGAHMRALSQNVPQVPQVPQLDKNVNDNDLCSNC